jgi:hypothetical protein
MLKFFGSKNYEPPFEVAGAILGAINPEVEGIIELDDGMGNYYVKSFNNSSGICSYVTLRPIDSEEEPRFLTQEQMGELLNFLQLDFGGIFGRGCQMEDGTGYLSFKRNNCEIFLLLKDDRDSIIHPEVRICHIATFKQLKKEMDSFSSYQDWFVNRIKK